MVTAERVWAALAELPDPEIPVISLVDLGVVRDVAVDGDRVTIEFTPTFLGCPALEVMRDRMADAVRDLGGEPDVRVVLDDSWSTDRITPDGRAKLREARLRRRARPASRRSCSSRLRRSAAPTAGRPRPIWRTCSGRRRAARSATARAAGSRSSSSRRSESGHSRLALPPRARHERALRVR